MTLEMANLTHPSRLRLTLGDLIRECEDLGLFWEMRCNSLSDYKDSIFVRIANTAFHVETKGDEPEETFERALSRAKTMTVSNLG